MDLQEILHWIQHHITGCNMSSEDELWIHRRKYYSIRCYMSPYDAA